jgi:hypothetical protein
MKQTPSAVAYFKGETGGATAYYFPEQTSFGFATGTPTGVQSVSGTNVFFDTYANIVAWIGNSGSATKTALTDSDFFRDMGKEYNIYYYQEVAPTKVNVPIHALTISKAQKIISPGETTEGVVGNIPSGSDLKNYNTTYLVTWTANPDASTGVPVGVARTGYY